MAGDKYKLKIVKVGIGDPYIMVETQFDSSGVLPTEDPVSVMQVQFMFSLDGVSYQDFGIVETLRQLDTMGPYYFGLPFDPGSGFDMGDEVWVQIHFNSSPYATDVNDTDSHIFTQQLTYLGGPNEPFSIPIYYNWLNGG